MFFEDTHDLFDVRGRRLSFLISAVYGTIAAYYASWVS